MYEYHIAVAYWLRLKGVCVFVVCVHVCVHVCECVEMCVYVFSALMMINACRPSLSPLKRTMLTGFFDSELPF